MAEATYRLGIAHVLRLAGTVVIGLGVLWLVATLLGGGGAVRSALTIVTVLVVLALIALFVRPPRILSLDADGYRVRWVRGAGRRAASWRQVDNVYAQGAGVTATMIVELSDATSTRVPLTLLGTRQREAQRDVHERLNAAHGYRRLD